MMVLGRRLDVLRRLERSIFVGVEKYLFFVGVCVVGCFGFRAVSLVGDGERKLLKELIKKAKIPAKSRVIPQEVVISYRDRIQELAEEIKAILKKEREEKEVRIYTFRMYVSK